MYVELKNISFRYPTVRDLTVKDLSFSVAQSSIAAIRGPSGSGKSTVLRLIAGLEKTLAGSISINGETVDSKKIYIPPEKRNVGMVFQNYALFPHLTAAKNIAYGIRKQERKNKIIDEMLDLTNMQKYKYSYPHQLSGGQQQRIAIARSLATKPGLLLLDEPFSGLDAHLKNRIRAEIKNILLQAKITCIFVTHDEEDIVHLTRQVITL